MNRKQKIIISVTGIFLVLLILVGLTYAYFLTQITGNTKEKSISVTTANLQLLYIDGTNIILDENTKLKPSNNPIGVKTFSVYNDGDSVVENYNIYLEDVVNELERTEDLVYTLTCTSTDEENSPCTNQIEEETEFPNLYGTILKNSIAPLVTHTYTLTLTYKETGTDQSVDMNKQINAKINIYDDNEIENRLNEIIMNDTRITKNQGTPEFTGVETNEVGMYSAEDDYGTSWYFRGAQSYNYVKFAGFTWRIVRINGDGSIRLILADEFNKIYRENEDGTVDTSTLQATLSTLRKFNDNRNDNAYVGYMHGNFEGNTTEYNQAHENKSDSRIKQGVDIFYTTYIENDANNYHYGKYMTDTLFCGDKTLAKDGVSNIAEQKGYGDNDTIYAAYERIQNSTAATQTLKCAENAENTYSRYTSKLDLSEQTIKSVKVNNDLNYPIALLSVDELVMAGAWPTEETTTEESHFLAISTRFWTMTPNMVTGGWSEVYAGLGNKIAAYTTASNYAGIRPVINLKNSVLISSGDGTYQFPYILQEID